MFRGRLILQRPPNTMRFPLNANGQPLRLLRLQPSIHDLFAWVPITHLSTPMKVVTCLFPHGLWASTWEHILFMTIIVSESAVNSERMFGFAGALMDILTFRNRATHF